MSQGEKTQPLREESETWKEAYRDPQLIARRTKKHRGKMVRLGMRSWPRDARIVDIACGTGEVLRILHSEGFTNLVGLDVTVDPGLAREPWLETKVGDGRSLPFPDQSFDIAVCTHSLHHLGGMDGIRSSLTGAKRILKPGGRLALIDHFDSAQLRFALWCCRQSWLTWPTSGLRSFRKQLDEEWSYLTEYMDGWPKVRAIIDDLGFQPVDVDSKGLFFFYWVGRKPQ